MVKFIDLTVQIDGHKYVRIAAIDDERTEQPYAGTVDVARVGDAAAFRQLFVYEAYRRQGVASRLLDLVEEIAREAKLKTCECLCAVENVRARALYEKRGYVAAREQDGFYEMVLAISERGETEAGQ